MTAAQRNPDDISKRIEADGAHTAAQIARRFFSDVRVLPLFHDLNPGLAATGPVRAGVVVTLPSKNQARAFARRHGFTLGFNERAGNGTDARRRWAVLVGDSAPRGPEPLPADLARSLLARGVSPSETARRVHRQCRSVDLRSLTDAGDARLAQVAHLVEGHRLHPMAVSRVATARAVLDTSLRPAGFRKLCEGLCRDAAAGRALLLALFVTPPLVDALIAAAPRVVAALTRARAIAGEERSARDTHCTAEPTLTRLVHAFVDGVEPLSADRLADLGLAAEQTAFGAHLEKLATALRQAQDALPRSPLDVVRVVATGTDAGRLARPWPVVVRVVSELSALSRKVPVAALDDGLGGLLAPVLGASDAGAAVPLAVLCARAAVCARADDEGDAFAKRLAVRVVELFDALRPPPVLDGGAPHTRRARRKAAFDLAVTARGPIAAAGVAALFDDAMDAARGCGVGRPERLKPQQVDAARKVASQLVGPMSVARRPLSELGRALVVAAMAVEPDLAQGLARPTGQEAFMQTAARHAARVLSAAACRLHESAYAS